MKKILFVLLACSFLPAHAVIMVKNFTNKTTFPIKVTFTIQTRSKSKLPFKLEEGNVVPVKSAHTHAQKRSKKPTGPTIKDVEYILQPDENAMIPTSPLSSATGNQITKIVIEPVDTVEFVKTSIKQDQIFDDSWIDIVTVGKEFALAEGD